MSANIDDFRFFQFCQSGFRGARDPPSRPVLSSMLAALSESNASKAERPHAVVAPQSKLQGEGPPCTIREPLHPPSKQIVYDNVTD